MVRGTVRVDYPVSFGLAVGWSLREGSARMCELSWRDALVVDSDWVPEVGELIALDVRAHGPHARPLQIQGLVTRRGPRCFWLLFPALDRELIHLMRSAATPATPSRAPRSGAA